MEFKFTEIEYSFEDGKLVLTLFDLISEVSWKAYVGKSRIAELYPEEFRLYKEVHDPITGPYLIPTRGEATFKSWYDEFMCNKKTGTEKAWEIFEQLEFGEGTLTEK